MYFFILAFPKGRALHYNLFIYFETPRKRRGTRTNDKKDFRFNP